MTTFVSPPNGYVLKYESILILVIEPVLHSYKTNLNRTGSFSTMSTYYTSPFSCLCNLSIFLFLLSRGINKKDDAEKKTKVRMAYVSMGEAHRRITEYLNRFCGAVSYQDSPMLCRLLSFSSNSPSLLSLADALNVFQVL